MLELKNISKEYITSNQKVRALKNINLEFKNNQFVSILGPSGCGKTTLLNIIGGLDKYSKGDLIIYGKSTKDYKDREWDTYRNHNVGFIFQNYNLIPHLNVLKNVELALTLSGVGKDERKRRAIQVLTKVGLKDKLNSKPNQLSGGEMQRVAIARALVNEPEILLADEPTGALDTKTSIQILDLLKEIAKDKLVIMVTHNQELAETYSNRIIKLLDGNVVDDIVLSENESLNKQEMLEKKKKTSMNFFTALSLSFKNLFTKKIRTLFTLIAGSIGIIGVALVLSLSNGMNKYMDKIQSDTLSNYPITIGEKAVNVTEIVSAILSKDINLDKYPKVKEIYINEILDIYNSMNQNNNITEEYIKNVIENIDHSLINGITYNKDVEINLFTNNGLMKQEVNNKNMYVKLTTSNVWYQLLDNEEFIKSQYDIIEGRLPTNEKEIVIIVDKYNQLTDATLMAIGLYEPGQENNKYTFDELMGLEFKVLTNEEMYSFENNKFVLNGVKSNSNILITEENYNKGENLKVVGILRSNKNTSISSIYSGIAYSPKLIDYIIEKNRTSTLAKYLEDNVNIDPFTGNKYISTSTDENEEMLYKNDLRKYGVDDSPTKINIYPKNFETKEKVLDILDDYNEGKAEKNKIRYVDLTQFIIDVIRMLIKGISYALVAFSAISLVVSSIMIAIITYISVIERTKEIGVLRSIGARKKDIIRVFNAETFIIGLLSGLLAILVTIPINLLINLIIGSYAIEIDNIATLSINHALILILVSIVLTLISGLIPAFIAAKKDPVEALRSE